MTTDTERFNHTVTVNGTEIKLNFVTDNFAPMLKSWARNIYAKQTNTHFSETEDATITIETEELGHFIHMQGSGKTKAVHASTIKVGDVVRYSFGKSHTVTDISPRGKTMVNLHFATTTTRKFKLTSLVPVA